MAGVAIALTNCEQLSRTADLPTTVSMPHRRPVRKEMQTRIEVSAPACAPVSGGYEHTMRK